MESHVLLGEINGTAYFSKSTVTVYLISKHWLRIV